MLLLVFILLKYFLWVIQIKDMVSNPIVVNTYTLMGGKGGQREANAFLLSGRSC